MEIGASANTTLPPGQVQRLRAQATELEGVFLQTLVKEMFATVEKDESFDGGFGEETWRGMQAEQFAQTLAESGGIGLSDQILGDLIRLQEAAQSPANAIGAFRS